MSHKIQFAAFGLLCALMICGSQPAFSQQSNSQEAPPPGAQSHDTKPDSSKVVEKDGIYEVGGSVKAPKLISGEDANPFACIPDGIFHKKKQNRISALSLIVDTKGNPRNIEILKKLSANCDESAVTAVRSYKFEPGTLNGKPVPVRIEVNIEFHRY